MSATEKLQRALLAMAENGRRPRCGDWAEGSPWLSDEPAERLKAAGWCQGCPILDDCDAAAVELKVRFGVWAGRDRTPRTYKASTGAGES